MRMRIIAMGLLLLSMTVFLNAQTGQDLYQQAVGRETLGDYAEAIRIYDRIIRDFPRDRALVARATLRLGITWTRLGDNKGSDLLNSLINGYKDQPAVVEEARRFLATQPRPVQDPKWSQSDRLLIADFQDRTDKTAGDDQVLYTMESLNAALRMQLEQSPYLKIVSYPGVAAVFARLNRPWDGSLTAALALEVCTAAGVKGVLIPAISRLPPPRALTLEVVNCSKDAETISIVQTASLYADDAVITLAKLASSLRADLGEPADSITRFDSLRAVTTKSIAALTAYQNGYRLRAAATLASARTALLQAVRLDPNFASAYSLASTLGFNNAEDRQNATDAYRLRDQVSERERLTIEAQYYSTVVGDVDKVITTLEGLRDLYPNDGYVRYLLGDQYRLAGRFEKGLQELQQAVRLIPESSVARESLMRNSNELNRFSDAKSIFNQAVDAEADAAFGLHTARYAVAVMEGDTGAAQEQLLWLNARSIYWQDQALIAQGEYAAVRGDLASTKRLREEFLLKGSSAPVKAYFTSREARTRALYADPAEALQLIKSSLLSRSYQRVSMAVVTYGLTGDAENVEALTREIRAEFPDDIMMNVIWLPTAAAALEIRKGNGAGAVKLLAPAAAYEPGANSMWAVYMRGLAYLQMESGAAAAAEFRKIIDHRGVDLMSPLYPIAHIRLAEAYALMGNVASARKTYEEFFSLWKNADPDVPIFKEAKAKYEQLRTN